MNIEKLNSWLSLIANVGVLAGIVFLALELQQSTNVARVSEYRENIQDIADWRSTIASDAELSSIWRAYSFSQMDELDQAQKSRIDLLLLNLFGSYENAYYANKLGIIEDSEWNRFLVGTCIELDRLYLSFPERVGVLPFSLTEEFQEYIKSNC